jgi:putative N6-adenine-specific DNA methylase
MAVLAGNPAFESAFHRKPTKRLPFWNGPIECRLLQYGSAQPARSAHGVVDPDEEPFSPSDDDGPPSESTD